MDRATTPVVGAVLLIALTVVAAGGVALAVSATTADPPPTAAVETTADAGQNEIKITHRGGDTLDVTALSVRVIVEGEPLAEQPPVPFFAASGFRAGPSGPFNPASSNEFHAGETASLRLATTNQPLLSSGDSVTVELRSSEGIVARSETVAT